MQGADASSMSNISQSPPGVVELREDIPLKGGLYSDQGRCCSGGPRFIIGSFAVLTVAITIALMTQIHYGDYELVPHGVVSSSAANCSEAGTDVLKDGGTAVDAAIAVAVCLAVVAPHRTSIDASGSLLFWEYRKTRTTLPTLIEWGASQGSSVEPTKGNNTEESQARAPRLLHALAVLHTRYGTLPWSRLLQPAIDLASQGFRVSEGLSIAAAARGEQEIEGAIQRAPLLANYLQTLQQNSSSELAAFWTNTTTVDKVIFSEVTSIPVGNWRVWIGGAGTGVAVEALAKSLTSSTINADTAFQNVVTSLQVAAMDKSWPPPGVASGMAIVDSMDRYLALVTGLSVAFGSGPGTRFGWTMDEPTSPLDLAPAFVIDEHICGTRYIIGAESSGALAQATVSLITNNITNTIDAVERTRIEVQPGGTLAAEILHQSPQPVALPPLLINATLPYPAVNLVQQRGDNLMSHADSRGGGVASRF